MEQRTIQKEMTAPVKTTASSAAHGIYTTRRLLLGISALTLFACALYAVLFVMIRAKNEHIAETTNALSREVEREQRLKALRASLDDLSTERYKLLSFVAYGDDVVAVVERVESLARIADVSIDVASVTLNENAEGADSKKTITAEIEVRGTWRDVTHFIALLETMPLRLAIPSLSLAYIGDDAPEGAAGWAASLSLIVPSR